MYAATFGGGLLLAGRLADRGGRRTFLTGLLIFALASALCGAAWSVPIVIAGRALQGVGAALASPAALSLLTTTFAEGPARDRALGAWASVAAVGGAAGLVLGGLLASTIGWRSVFWINVPVIAVVVVAAVRVLPASGPVGQRGERRPLVPVTAGMTAAAAVVLLVVSLPTVETGASAALVGLLLAAAVAAGALFLGLDRRAADPLLPPALPRSRPVAVANLATAAMSARLGYSPLATGLAFLPITAVNAVTALASGRLAGRLGPRVLVCTGMACLVLRSLPSPPKEEPL